MTVTGMTIWHKYVDNATNNTGLLHSS